MFKYKREAIFTFESSELLDILSENEVKNFLDLKLEIKRLEKKILNHMLSKSEHYYNNGEIEISKKVSALRRRIKSGGTLREKELLSIDFDNELRSEVKILLDNRTKFNGFVKHYTDVLQKSVNRYNYFLGNELFKEYLYEIQPFNSKYILDEEKYSKANYRKTRYSYIQRNIFKTNTISLSGLTTFFGGVTSKTIGKVSKPNIYRMTCLLLLLSIHKIMKYRIRFKKPISLVYEGYNVILNEKHFLLKELNGFFIRDNLLFFDKVVNILNGFADKKFFTYNDLLTCLSKEELDLLISNNVLNPDFNFYVEHSDEIEEIIADDVLLSKLYYSPETLTIVEKNELRSNFKEGFLEDFLFEALENSTYSVNYYSQYSQDYDEVIDFDFFTRNKDFLEKNVIRDPLYNQLLTIIDKSQIYKSKNLLEILFILEGKILYKTDFWDTNNLITDDYEIRDFETYEKRSYLIFFNELSNGEIIVNNIFPGNGFLTGREYPKLDTLNKLKLGEHLKDNYQNEFPLYELVINPHTTIINSSGQTNFPKIIWPDDIGRIRITFEQNKVTFLLDDNPINLMYFGSIPPQQFNGVQKILLSLITPWKMKNNDGISNNLINNRSTIYIHYKDIEYLLDASSSLNTMMNLYSYFNKNNIPIKFFMYDPTRGYLKDKPQYITLLNPDALLIFVAYLKKHKKIIIMEVSPNLNNYFKDKLEEKVYLLKDEEL